MSEHQQNMLRPFWSQSHSLRSTQSGGSRKGNAAHVKPHIKTKKGPLGDSALDNKVATVISFQMLKGGVAKTTSALNVGIRASHLGLKVLLVDLDQQANLSFAAGATDPNLAVWVDIIDQKVSIEKTILPICEGLDLIPSNLNNSVLEKVLSRSHRNWVTCVQAPLNQIKNRYDWIIIDTAPSLSMLNTAVTYASDLIILPVTPDPFALLGLQKHLQELEEIKKDFHLSGLHYKILFSRFDAREILSQKYLDYLCTNFKDFLLDSYIRVNSDIKKVQGSSGKSIFQLKSAASEDYDLVTKELIHWWKENCNAQYQITKEESIISK
ncbi:MAG: ParA family protein [Bdellovibrionaceae bacterium]|nr:ParA family protein [Pseudobdellovibrionaceae bacterium]MDW8189948.1 ParA family protein [Pseudobdellovibrionaceae bacterium]